MTVYPPPQDTSESEPSGQEVTLAQYPPGETPPQEKATCDLIETGELVSCTGKQAKSDAKLPGPLTGRDWTVGERSLPNTGSLSCKD